MTNMWIWYIRRTKMENIQKDNTTSCSTSCSHQFPWEEITTAIELDNAAQYRLSMGVDESLAAAATLGGRVLLVARAWGAAPGGYGHGRRRFAPPASRGGHNAGQQEAPHPLCTHARRCCVMSAEFASRTPPCSGTACLAWVTFSFFFFWMGYSCHVIFIQYIIMLYASLEQQ